MNRRFHGAWLLESYAIEHPGGRSDAPLGDAPVGLFTFHESGYFSVQLGPRSDTGEGYSAFYGTWTSDDGEAGVALLTVVAGSAPARIQGVLTRNFTFLEPNLLRMRPPQNADGSQATILWRRTGSGD